MLIITVEIASHGERRVLARAHVANMSNLAEISNYGVGVSEGGNPLARTPPWTATGSIEGHHRNQSVWALVSKVAEWGTAQAARRKESP